VYQVQEGKEKQSTPIEMSLYLLSKPINDRELQMQRSGIVGKSACLNPAQGMDGNLQRGDP
jgi:hypothetical protein